MDGSRLPINPYAIAPNALQATPPRHMAVMKFETNSFIVPLISNYVLLSAPAPQIPASSANDVTHCCQARGFVKCIRTAAPIAVRIVDIDLREWVLHVVDDGHITITLE
jgi:hypothetical protein